jgi:Tfp pilus assembly protein PilF
MAETNFNYQVALKDGLKNLQQGRLRQAEQSFKYLVDKFPGAEGGYRGLAKVHFEQEERAAALKVLRDGASALTKSGERAAAIGLLREAITLDPRDLATHRRLAAALALSGDPEAAVQEYARFIRDLRDAGDVDRARSETAYAMSQLKHIPSAKTLEAIAAEEATPPAPHRAPEDTPRASGTGPTPMSDAVDPWMRSGPPREALREEQTPSSLATEPTVSDPWAAPPPLRYTPPPAPEPPSTAQSENDPWLSRAFTPSAPPSVASPASSGTEAWSPPSIQEPLPASQANGRPTIPADQSEVEAAAALYLATRDPRAAGMALEAARRYIKEGHTDAASDLLLQLIAAGVADHDAQRLLVDVARTLGKREVAKAKCQLLVQALLLDGRNDLAAEVEALAQGD